jgi:hypothetical protein
MEDNDEWTFDLFDGMFMQLVDNLCSGHELSHSSLDENRGTFKTQTTSELSG